MSTTQRYWLLFSPGLILMTFFFGIGGFLFLFIPSYFVYQAHRRGWGIVKTTLLALALIYVGLGLHSYT